MSDPAAPVPPFPAWFVWGVATSSYQIEGAAHEDGRGPSIWDTFARRPGAVADGSTGDVACDHYHRWPQDLDLIADLGVSGYRFSIAWPRVLPDGVGRVEPRGLDFYDRLVDGLAERGVQAYPTLFHWDLPQALQDRGGWLRRDTAEAFADYAAVVADRLGDRVAAWWTLNEPVVHAMLGHGLGVHAPGSTLQAGAFPAAHHQLLGHGLAVRALRARSATPVGIVHNLAPAEPLDPRSPGDVAAARVFDGVWNRTYLDSVLLGRYPDDTSEVLGVDESCVLDGDLAVIGTPLDLLGVNYYNPQLVREPGPDNPLGFEITGYTDVPTTALGWPVLPDRLTSLLVGLRDTYGPALPPLLVTENGCASDDAVVDGAVHDTFRVRYLDAHVRAVHAALEQGVDVRGYFAWSLLDNFEWAEGYRARFGLVHVDYATQQRTPKDSYAWVRALVAGSGGSGVAVRL